jgi:hypothetical protein
LFPVFHIIVSLISETKEVVMTNATVFTGHGIEMFALLSLKGRLYLEMAGMKGRGESALSQAKTILGLTGRPPAQKVYDLLLAHIEEQAKLIQRGDIETPSECLRIRQEAIDASKKDATE